MITDYDQQFRRYEHYRQSVRSAPPGLRLADAPTNVRRLFAPLDEFIRALLQKQTVDNVSASSHSPDDESDRYYASRLVFCINADTSINAFADYSQDGYYIISINAGLYAAITAIFHRLFMYPFVFPQIGPTSNEPKDPIVDETRPIDYFIDNLESFLVNIPCSRSRTRVQAADTCAVLAALFTAYHELGHVFRGHIDYERKTGQPTRLCEVGDASYKGPPATASRLLEYDADNGAIIETTRVALLLRPLVVEYGAHFNAALCMFALTVLFFVFDHQRTDVTSTSRDSYPHPEARAFDAFTKSHAESLFAALGHRWGGPQIAPPTPEKSRELLKASVQYGIAANHLLGSRRTGQPVVASPKGIEDVFPDLSVIRLQLSELYSQLQSLKPSLKDAKVWARGNR